MKAGIITINSAHNYGCMYQAWALRTYLEKIGLDAEIINYRYPEIDDIYQPFKVKKRFKKKLLQKLYVTYHKIRFKFTGKENMRKYNLFEDFIANDLHTTEVFTNFRELKDANLASRYDVLITGSDQVWNSTITVGLKPAYFLGFAEDIKKIAYAPSIGKTSLKNYEKEFFKEFLKDYHAIGLREESAAELLAPLTDKELSVVLDPTFLLEISDYEKIRKPGRFNGKYIMVHVINEDTTVRPIAEALSKKTGLPVIHNRSTARYSNELGRFNDAGPGEFLSLVMNASYVVTNSFHATVFALMYKRDFFTIPHKKYPERMVHLLNICELSERLVSSPDALETIPSLSVDFDKTASLLKEAKTKSRNFLHDALEIPRPLQ